MRSMLCALLGAALLLCSNAGPASAAVARPAACSKIVLTGHPTYPPVAWAAAGTLHGAGIAIVRRLAKDAGVPLVVVDEGSWEGAQAAVKSGKADAIVGLYLTRARLPFFDYVHPAIAPDPSAVVVRAGDPFVYTNWNSLIGKRGAVSAGEAYGHQFDVFMRTKLQMQQVAGFDGVYAALLHERADFGLVGYYAAITGAPKTIRIAASNFVTEGLYLAFGKGSPCGRRFSAAFARDIARLAKDGTVKRLFDASLAEYSASRR